MRSKVFASVLAAGLCAFGVSGAEAALEERYMNADSIADGYYDTVLNVTWLADFNFGKTEAGLVAAPDGKFYTTFEQAQSWASGLDVYGVTGWRLPTISGDLNTNFSTNGSTDYGTAQQGTGWGTKSELGELFYVALNNAGNPTPSWSPPSPSQLQNTGSFMNFADGAYWIDRDYPSGQMAWSCPPSSPCKWDFDTWDGSQDEAHTYGNARELAVALHSGDVGFAAPVPEPATYVLTLAGLGAVGFVGRRRRQTRE